MSSPPAQTDPAATVPLLTPQAGPVVPARSRSRLRVIGVALLGLTLAAVGYAAGGAWFGKAKGPVGGVASSWQAAQTALAEHDLAQARTHLEAVLAVCPLNAEAHFVLARTCRRAGDLTLWRAHLHRAQVLSWPKEAIDLERRLARAQTGDVWGVEDRLLADLDAYHPDEELILEALVRGYLEINSFGDVLRWCGVWLRRYPNAWQPLAYRGRTYQLSNMPDRAIADLRRALERKPDLEDARAWLAGGLMLDGQFHEALKQYQAYGEARPDNVTALVGIANCQFSLGDTGAALQTVERLLARYPDNPAGLLLRAKIDLQDGAADAALATLKRAETLSPQEPDILQALIQATRQLGRHTEADAYERQLKDIYQTYERLNGVQKQILQEPENLSARYEAGRLLMHLGRRDEAAKWFRSLLRLDANHRPTHQALAEYYQQSGDKGRAEFHRRRAGGQRTEEPTP